MLNGEELRILSSTCFLSPNKICHKVFTPEHFIQQHFQICHLTIINLHKEYTILTQEFM